MGRNRVRNTHRQPPCSERPWTVREVVQAYLINRARDVERGLLAPRTLRDYRWVLEHFCEAFGSWRIHALKPAHVVQWIDSHSAWKSNARVGGVVRAIKACFSWWSRLYGEPHPLSGLRAPTADPRRPLRPDEFDAIMDVCRCPYTKGALLFMWLTGCRPKELCDMRRSDLDEVGGVYLVCLRQHKTRRRTKKLRVIVLGQKTKAVVDRVLALEPRARTHIFCGPSGRPWKRDNLSRRFAHLRLLAGVPPDVTLYSIRHAAALRAYRAGVDGQALADYLGTSPLVLDRYYLSQSREIIIRLAAVAEVLEAD